MCDFCSIFYVEKHTKLRILNSDFDAKKKCFIFQDFKSLSFVGKRAFQSLFAYFANYKTRVFRSIFHVQKDAKLRILASDFDTRKMSFRFWHLKNSNPLLWDENVLFQSLLAYFAS